MDPIKEAFTFDDVTLAPNYSEIMPSDVITETVLSKYLTLKIPLLFISTAGIFDGKKELYDDWDMPNPIGHYARSKYIAEKYVQNHTNEYLICRAGWMMGGGLNKDKKFVNKIIKQIQATFTQTQASLPKLH